MKLLNVILGLKTASSKHPCCICIAEKPKFQSLNSDNKQPFRDFENPNIDKTIQPYKPIIIPASPLNIVPLPLHLILGLIPNMIKSLEDKNKALVKDMNLFHTIVKQINSVHVTGEPSGGASGYFAFTGDEIERLLNFKLQNSFENQSLFQILARLFDSESNDKPEEERKADEDALFKLGKMHEWSIMLWDYLVKFKKEDFLDQSRLEKFRLFVDDIHTNWTTVTGNNYTPKLHMLVHHVHDFILNHGCLSELSEKLLESTHAQINASIREKFLHELKDISTLFSHALDDYYRLLTGKFKN